MRIIWRKLDSIFCSVTSQRACLAWPCIGLSFLFVFPTLLLKTKSEQQVQGRFHESSRGLFVNVADDDPLCSAPPFSASLSSLCPSEERLVCPQNLITGAWQATLCLVSPSPGPVHPGMRNSCLATPPLLPLGWLYKMHAVL